MTSNPQLPGVSLEQWASDVLAGLGVPVSKVNISTLMTWAQHESGGGSSTACAGRYNPLNTTESALGYACEGGAQGDIKGFASYQQGVNAIVYNLTHTKGVGYDGIIAGLRANNQQQTFAAIDASAFGTKNLGGGGVIQPGGGTTTGTSSSGGSSSSSGGCPEGNLVTFPGPIPNITKCQGRALLGGVCLLAGGLLLVAGLIVVAAGTGPGKQAARIIVSSSRAAAA